MPSEYELYSYIRLDKQKEEKRENPHIERIRMTKVIF